MANKKRGYYTIQLGGKNRTLHFSMNFWAAFTDELGITLADIDKLFAGGLNLSEIRALIYAAILANDQEQNNLIDYNVYTVGAWLEDVTADQITEIIGVMTESKLLGNELNGGISRNATKSTKESTKKKTQKA